MKSPAHAGLVTCPRHTPRAQSLVWITHFNPCEKIITEAELMLSRKYKLYLFSCVTNSFSWCFSSIITKWKQAACSISQRAVFYQHPSPFPPDKLQIYIFETTSCPTINITNNHCCTRSPVEKSLRNNRRRFGSYQSQGATNPRCPQGSPLLTDAPPRPGQELREPGPSPGQVRWQP